MMMKRWAKLDKVHVLVYALCINTVSGLIPRPLVRYTHMGLAEGLGTKLETVQSRSVSSFVPRSSFITDTCRGKGGLRFCISCTILGGTV